jgi:2-methylisocitrate lyase-like PEP mutase family enzyme
MDRTAQRHLAESLQRLHAGPQVLVVGSAWDAGSAVIFERAGFAAIATSSAGMAFSLGYADGERVPRDELLAAIARIVRAVRVPVTADIESGYGRGAEAVADTCRRVLDCGAVGVNIEDALSETALADVERQAALIGAVRSTAQRYGVPLVINARTDVYMQPVADASTAFAEAVQRLNRYRAAGADCLFAPGLKDAATIGRLASALDGPLNILAVAGTPAVAELAALGVRRISQGSGPARAAIAATQRAATALHDDGTYDAFTRDAISYADANRLYADRG